ncbi:hypothetical protein ACOSQ4_029226 [Xanthoceras sorbifolium]
MDAILSIPPSSPYTDDSHCWHYDKSGIYSVKSANWLSMQNNDRASSSSSGSLWWKTMWKLHIPSKIKFFLWKASLGWLSSLMVLTARKVPTHVSCFLCNAEVETPVHAIWGCCKLKPMRKLFSQLAGLAVHNANSLLNLFCVCSEVPSPGWFKINSDAIVDVSKKQIGIGVVIRDGNGLVMAVLAKRHNSLLSMECAEGLAILEGLKFAQELGIHPVGVESDDASVVALINKKSPPRSELRLIISEILLFEVSLSIRSFSFRPRQCNRVAHGLAKFGVNVSISCFWVEITPPCVQVICVKN